ncbi:MAG: hypothetical protein PGN09_08115 [Sphingomonas fennica]
MYSESDIEAAVADGALTPEAAAALRASVSRLRATPAADEESFRLVTGFNDIFVTIAAILLLVAVWWIGRSIGAALLPAPEWTPGEWTDASFAALRRSSGAGNAIAGLLTAAASWGLAEYFTRARRMALPSIVLLLSFAIGVSAIVAGSLTALTGGAGERTLATIAAASGIATAAAAYAHWRRFHVPITIAALTAALVVTTLALLVAAVPAASRIILWLMLAAGLAVFAFAMWWDVSDRERTTRRSDVAFWLHLGAAPLIAHPVFWLLGLLEGDVGAGRALIVILLYLGFGAVALAVDRRAILVSSLVYVLYALSALFRSAGAVGLSLALTGLMIGSALLLLSAFWQPIRRRVVTRLPAEWQARLPVAHRRR